MIDIAPGISISECELSFTFGRSPGPGGQNVNKVNTRVTLSFDVVKSLSLTSAQRNLVRKSLPTRISQDGVLRIVSSKERTQLSNRRAAVGRFVELMSEALSTPEPRKKTCVPASAQKKRVDDKVCRGKLKRSRQTPDTIDD